jgi:hypothetical protein
VSLFTLRKGLDDSALADATCAEARALVQRGAPFVPDEATVLASALPLLLARPIADGLDVLTVMTCSRFPRVTAPAPERPSPFDAAIEEAERELAVVQARELDARGEYQRLVDRARASASRPERQEAVLAEADAAREAHRQVDGEWLRVRSRLVALGLSRTRWQIEQGA